MGLLGVVRDDEGAMGIVQERVRNVEYSVGGRMPGGRRGASAASAREAGCCRRRRRRRFLRFLR